MLYKTAMSQGRGDGSIRRAGKRERLGVLCRLLGKVFLLDQKRQDEGRACVGWGSRNSNGKTSEVGETLG